LVVEAQKKLNTTETFSVTDVEWTAPESYASRFVPWPDKALQIRKIIIGGNQYFESKYSSVNMISSNEFFVKDNKIWFSFIPSKVVMNCAMIPVDADGLPMVNENHVEAIARYIIFTKDYAEFRKGNIPRLVYKETELLKNKAFRQARGADNMPTWEENKRANQQLGNMYSRYYLSNNVTAQLLDDFQGTQTSA